MPISIYYDGSADETRTAVVTLTGVAATDEIWKQVEPFWNEVLKRYSISRLHMAQLMAGDDEKRKGDVLGEVREKSLSSPTVLYSFHGM